MIYPSQETLSLQGFYSEFPCFSVCFPLRWLEQALCIRSQIIKSLCAWKHSPYSRLSEIGWKMSSGSHEFLLVFDISIWGMKSGQGRKNPFKKGRGRRKGEQQWNGSSFSEAGSSGLDSWARDLWVFLWQRRAVSENLSAWDHRGLKWVLGGVIIAFMHPGRKDNKKTLSVHYIVKLSTKEACVCTSLLSLGTEWECI